MGDEIVEMPIVYGTAPTVAEQQCGREPDAYEVRCTDGNYEWRRPYHGELEVIMSTGRDRSGKPFEYRALYAAVSPLPTVTPAEVGGHANAQTEAQAIQRYIAPSAGRGAVVQLLKHCDGEWVRYEDHATALAAKDAELAELRADALKVGDQMLAEKFRADNLAAQLAEANKALDLINTEARSFPVHTSAVTRETVLTSKLTVIRDAARRAREAQGGENNG